MSSEVYDYHYVGSDKLPSSKKTGLYVIWTIVKSIEICGLYVW